MGFEESLKWQRQVAELDVAGESKLHQRGPHNQERSQRKPILTLEAPLLEQFGHFCQLQSDLPPLKQENRLWLKKNFQLDNLRKTDTMSSYWNLCFMKRNLQDKVRSLWWHLSYWRQSLSDMARMQPQSLNRSPQHRVNKFHLSSLRSQSCRHYWWGHHTGCLHSLCQCRRR